VTAALIIIGAPGSGKTSVLDALCTLLEIEGVEFGAIESEQLARGWPWLTAERWTAQLAAVISLQRDAGRRLFLVAATTETVDELRGVVDAVGAERVLVVCLTASADLVARRVAAREPDRWLGKAELIEHARALASVIPTIPGIDLAIATDDREAIDAAAELRDTLRAAVSV
jgi:gluconate kinase